jgi:hypothetical protein
LVKIVGSYTKSLFWQKRHMAGTMDNHTSNRKLRAEDNWPNGLTGLSKPQNLIVWYHKNRFSLPSCLPASFSHGGVKAQDRISNTNGYGVYPGADQNVIINNDAGLPVPIGGVTNPNQVTGVSKLNFVGGFKNEVDGTSSLRAVNNLVYGRNNFIERGSNNIALGRSNAVLSSSNSGAIGKVNFIENSGEAYSLGGKTRIRGDEEEVVIGFGGVFSSNPLTGVGSQSITMGTYNTNTNAAYNTLNIRPPRISAANKFDAPVTCIGTTSPSAKLEIQNKGENDNTAQALSVLNSSSNPLFNVREDGWTRFSANPSAPYYFTETNNSPTGFSGGKGKANIVQDLGGFPFIGSGNKWISVGERPPDNNDNQIAYGYAAIWDNFAGNFFMDDVDQDGTKDLTISFQDAGVTDPDNASNRMRFIARDGDKIFQSGAFNELMSLYPEGEVAVGDYSGSVTPDAKRFEVKWDESSNGESLPNSEPIMKVLKEDNPTNQGTETILSINDNGNVYIGFNGNQPVGSKSDILQVDGDAFVNGSFTGSDARIKTDTQIINNPLEKIKKLDGLTYRYAENKYTEGRNFRMDDRHSGIIAQQLKEVLPEAVKKGVNGLYAVNYDAIIPLLIEANKNQQEQMETQEQQIQKQAQKIEQLEAKAQKVKTLEKKLEKLQKQVNDIQENKQESANRFKNENDEDLNKRTVTIDDQDRKQQAMLLQNRPNPYTNETVIPYYLPQNYEEANLLITNTNGVMIKRVSLKEAGKGELTLRTGNLKAGQYLYSLIVDGRRVETRKMVIKQ